MAGLRVKPTPVPESSPRLPKTMASDQGTPMTQAMGEKTQPKSCCNERFIRKRASFQNVKTLLRGIGRHDEEIDLLRIGFDKSIVLRNKHGGWRWFLL